jgi:hypothetical protein
MHLLRSFKWSCAWTCRECTMASITIQAEHVLHLHEKKHSRQGTGVHWPQHGAIGAAVGRAASNACAAALCNLV